MTNSIKPIIREMERCKTPINTELSHRKTINPLKNIIYWGYYIKTTNYRKLANLIDFVHNKYNISKFKLWVAPFIDAFRYQVSLEEYFMYTFFNKTAQEKQRWAGVGFMYEYHLIMAPKDTREIMLDKAKFLEYNKEFIRHKWLFVKDGDFAPLADFLSKITGKVVLKQVDGNCGIGVKIFDMNKASAQDIVNYAINNKLTLAEEYVVQHSDLMRLSPSGLNTLRIVTQINKKGEVDILAARVRITINSEVDNLHAGNMAAAIDIETGKIMYPAIYSDITKQRETIHPVTNVDIVGYQMPLWQEVIDAAKRIALHNKENRSVGWDIAITDKGVDFIEGNHDWNQDIFQMPIDTGLRGLLETYL